jgi:hypothetical protein
VLDDKPLRTVLFHTLCSLDTLGAAGPGLAVVPTSTLVVEWHRASGAAWSNFLSSGLGRCDYSLGSRFDCGLWCIRQLQR